MPNTFAYERCVAEQDLDSLRDAIFHALHIPDDVWETIRRRIPLEDFRAVTHQGRIVGGLAFYPMGQWFGGKSIPLTGVTLVGIAPEWRGQGAARTLMTSLLGELSEQGVPLSGLYASTQNLYRKVDYEQAGTNCSYSVHIESLRQHDRELPLIPWDGERGPLETLATKRAKMTNGNLDRSDVMWERLFSFLDKKTFTYLIGSADDPQGYVVYYQEAVYGEPVKLHVRDMVALSPAAIRRLWTFFADHRSMADTVIWYGPANEPLLNLADEFEPWRCRQERWMARIVNVSEALQQRGYPVDVEAELHLDVTDTLLPANNGRFVLRVAGGSAKVEPGGRGDLRTDARGLAPLYTGLFSPAVLKSTGQIDGDDRVLTIAERVFAGPEPWMPDHY